MKKITLISYFFEPLQNVAANRWKSLSQVLIKSGFEVKTYAGPWSKDTPTVEYVPDQVAQDSNPLEKHKENLFRKFFPKFILLDGKFLWSLKVFVRLVGNRKELGFIVVSGSPWSSVWAVSQFCRTFRKKYAVDFRDAWSFEPYTTYAKKISRKYQTVIEKRCIDGAEFVITINDTLKNHLQKINPKKTIIVIPASISQKITWTKENFNAVKNKKTDLIYTGTIGPYHDVGNFIKSTNYPIRFIGNDQSGLLKPYGFDIEPPVLESVLQNEIRKHGVALLLLGREAKHYTTGKLFTYIESGRPILYYGPSESPAAAMIEKYDLGWVVEFGNYTKLQEILKQIKEDIKSGKVFSFNPKISELNNYTIDEQALKLVSQLNLVS